MPSRKNQIKKPTINRLILQAFLVLAAGLFFVTGCSPLRPETDPEKDRQALALADQTRAVNQHIRSGKGSGWIRIENGQAAQKYRIAWAAQFPDKLRITFLFSGQPIETVLSTGTAVEFVSHTGNHDRHVRYAKDPLMKEYINVPVRMSEMICLLLGRFPVKAYNDAYFSPDDPGLSTLVIRDSSTGLKQILTFKGTGELSAIRAVEPTGSLLYNLNITAYQTYDAATIPAELEITDKGGRRLILSLTGFRPNPPLKETVFRLTVPD